MLKLIGTLLTIFFLNGFSLCANSNEEKLGANVNLIAEFTQSPWCRAFAWDTPPEKGTPLGTLLAFTFYDNGKLSVKNFTVADLKDRWVFADASDVTEFAGEWRLIGNQVELKFRVKSSRMSLNILKGREFTQIAEYQKPFLYINKEKYSSCRKLQNNLEEIR